jgi:hypothetical protein
MSKRTVEIDLKFNKVNGKVPSELKKDTDELTASVTAAVEEAGKLSGKFFDLNQVSQFVDSVSGAFRDLTGIMGEFTSAYELSVEANARLEQVMRNTMDASDAEIESIRQLASAQQALGVVEDDVILAGAQELATYMSKTETLQKLIPVMNDMVAQQYGFNATAENTVSIATMMGKVFEGQVSALSRYGYSFSDAEEEILKFGEEEERAAMMAEVIGRSVGGVNQALAQTDAGRMVQLRNTIGDVKEQIGKALMPFQTYVGIIAQSTTAIGGLTKIATPAIAALKGLTAAQLKSNAAALANPYVAAAAAVAALGVAIYKLSTRASEAEKHQRRLNEAVAEAQVRIGQEQKQAQQLFDALQTAGKGTDDYKEALKKVNDLYAEYLPKQLTDKSNLDEITAAYNRVNTAIGNKIVLEMRDAALSESATEEIKKQKDGIKALLKELDKVKVDPVTANEKIAGIIKDAQESRKAGETYMSAVSKAAGNYNLEGGLFGVKTRDHIEKIVASVYEMENATIRTNRAFAPLMANLASASALTVPIPGGEGDGGGGGKNSGGGSKSPSPAGSLGAMREELAKLNKEQLSADLSHAVELEKQIRLLEKQISLQEQKIKLGATDFTASPVAGPSLGKSAGAVTVPIKGDTSDLEKAMAQAGKKMEKSFSNADTFDALQESLDGITSTFRNLGDVIGESAAAWVEWGAGVLKAISSAIPQIAALRTAQIEQGTASIFAGATGAGASVSAIPIVGPILAVAAIASVLAAMMSIPKFAQGGLAYGPTLGLFGEYSGAASNPEVVAPLSKLRDMIGTSEMSGNVEFRIKDRDLVGILARANRRYSRVK